MESIPVRISKNQALKAKRGKPVQLAYSQLSGDSNIKLVLHPANAKKVQRAVRNQRGCRIILSPEEIQGSGLFDFLKNAGQWLKKNIIDTDFYQRNIRPVARELVKTGVSMIPGPQLARDVATKGVEYLGEKSSAFGMPSNRRRKNPTPEVPPPPGIKSIKGSSFKLQGKGMKTCPHCGSQAGSFRLN